MKTSRAGLKFITDNEKFEKSTFKDGKFYAHYDKIGKTWDIAWGLTYDDNSIPVDSETVWTYDYALSVFQWHIEALENRLNQLFTCYNIKLSQEQYDALVSFCYNVGINGFHNGKKPSTVFNYLKDGRINEVSNALMMWIYSKKEVVNGLINRRLKECFLFDKGIYTQDVEMIKQYDNGEYVKRIRG